jgi:hypothetical protein
MKLAKKLSAVPRFTHIFGDVTRELDGFVIFYISRASAAPCAAFLALQEPSLTSNKLVYHQNG